jgi:uncharacterized protein (DUF4415 family)
VTDDIQNPGGSVNTPQQKAAFDSIKKGLLEAIEHAEKSVDTTEITLWLDTDVLERFVATGAGWQSRVNDVLKAWVKANQ